MTRLHPWWIAATALVAVACVGGPLPPRARDERRLEQLHVALNIRHGEPLRAARLLAAAGEGPMLEHLRLELWLDCLERGDAGSDGWQALLASRLPADLRQRAVIGLGRALIRERAAGQQHAPPQSSGAGTLEDEDSDRLQEITLALVASPSPRARVVLLEHPEQRVRLEAAARLAVEAPALLRRHAPRMERSVVPGLSETGQLERAQAWLASGRPADAIHELSQARFKGDAEQLRRLGLAAAYIDRGSPAAALRQLPSARRCNAEQLLARARAYRREAWQRFPRASAAAAFRQCLDSARLAAAQAEGDATTRRQALRHVLECGTEAGALDEALGAWWDLAATGWQDEDRGWLGRRLGVALASRPEAAAALAGSMPDHERCLRFWSARSDRELRRLAEAPVADLYGQWSRVALDLAPPDRIELPAAVPEVEPPRPVALLVAWGALPEAAEEWQRLRTRRGTSAAEVLAAARFETRRGRPDRAIRWLLAAYPDLGGTGIVTAPVNVARAYLPLRWQEQLVAASQESGVPPWLLAALARQESLFVASARSPAGAVGVLQLIPSTAQVHGRALGLGARPDLTDPAVNLRLGAREIRGLIPRFGALEPALAAYNAGEARARRWWRQWPDAHRFTEAIPIPETYTYVRRVSFLAEAYRLVYRDLWGTLAQPGAPGDSTGSGQDRASTGEPRSSQ